MHVTLCGEFRRRSLENYVHTTEIIEAEYRRSQVPSQNKSGVSWKEGLVPDPRDTSLTKAVDSIREEFCSGCEREDVCSVLAAAYDEFDSILDGGPDFYCNRWVARA
jgi:hypothetical protein